MENRSDGFELPSHEINKNEINKSAAQVEECLETQIKPASEWFKHIGCLCNEVDDTISVLLSPSKEPINRKSDKQLPSLSVALSPLNKSVSVNQPPTIAQFQDLASKAQKELYGLKSQIQKDAPVMNLRQPQ